MNSGGSGACRSRGRRDAMPNPVSLTSPVARFTRIFAGLIILVQKLALIRLAKRGDDAERNFQEAAHRHRRAGPTVQRLATLILEQECRAPVFLAKFQRPHRPGGVQLVLQSIFMGQAFEPRG
jgi:hypothetical protein